MPGPLRLGPSPLAGSASWDLVADDLSGKTVRYRLNPAAIDECGETV